MYYGSALRALLRHTSIALHENGIFMVVMLYRSYDVRRYCTTVYPT
jgi:hypothetical protein